MEVKDNEYDKLVIRNYLTQELIAKYEELIAKMDEYEAIREGTAEPKQYEKEWWE